MKLIARKMIPPTLTFPTLMRITTTKQKVKQWITTMTLIKFTLLTHLQTGVQSVKRSNRKPLMKPNQFPKFHQKTALPKSPNLKASLIRTRIIILQKSPALFHHQHQVLFRIQYHSRPKIPFIPIAPLTHFTC